MSMRTHAVRLLGASRARHQPGRLPGLPSTHTDATPAAAASAHPVAYGRYGVRQGA